MKNVLKVAGIATLVAILGVVAVGAIAYAQDDGDGDGSTWPFNFRERFNQAVADVLGITVEEYDAALETAQERVLDEAVTEGWLTEDQADRMRERVDEGFGPGMRGGKFGPGRGHGGFIGGPEGSLVAVAAEELDMSVQDLMAELQDGKSIADVAGEKDVDPQTIADAYLAQLSDSLNQAVENGRLTQERADWMLEQASEKVMDQLEGTWEDCGPHGFPGGGRPGRMWGVPDETDDTSA
jgi:hypothetical protein